MNNIDAERLGFADARHRACRGRIQLLKSRDTILLLNTSLIPELIHFLI